MIERLFVDTSAWFAFANAADPDHAAVRSAMTGTRARLVTSNFVFDETSTLCRMRLGHGVATRVGTVLLDDDGIDLVRLSAADEREAWRLFGERGDQTYSFTDCTSFVVMRRLKIRRAVALDADFVSEGFEVVP